MKSKFLAHKYKRWIFSYFTLLTIVPLFFVSLFYAYDPLMFFRKPSDRDVTLVGNMRIQAAGVIHSLGHDSFILGTSMMENTSAVSASTFIGGSFANISMSGSDYYERSYALNYALGKNAKSIIYSLDSYYLKQRKGEIGSPASAYSYLYGDGLGRIKFYFQPKYFLCALTWSNSSKCVGKKRTTDRPKSWFKDKDDYARFGGLKNWFSMKNSPQINMALASISETAKRIKMNERELLDEVGLLSEVAKATQYVDKHVLSFVSSNPLTKFHLIFPPYSRIRYAKWHQLEVTQAKVHNEVVKHLARKATELSNLFVYGYEDQEFLDDIANYMDTGHYNEWVNNQMLVDIANGERLITVRNVDSYLKVARTKALAFDYIGLGREIDEHFESQ